MTTKIFTVGSPPAESTGADELMPNGHTPASLDQTIANLRAATDRALAALGGFSASQAASANEIPVAKADNSIALPGNVTMGGRLVGGFGASTSGGIQDWNDASNIIAGFGPVLLFGNSTNGPNTSPYSYHVMNLNYGPSKDAANAITQIAIPYYYATPHMYLRTRYQGVWTPWRQIPVSDINGRVVIGGDVVNTSGAKLQTADGLTFPATQVLSNDPNTLDDYEEGTFTPTAIGSTVAGVGTYSTQAGSYTKKGREVTVLGSLTVTAHTGTGLLRLTGLPFSPSGIAPPVLFRAYDITLGAGNVLQGYVLGSTVYLEQVPAGGGAVAAVNMDNAFTVTFMVTYFV